MSLPTILKLLPKEARRVARGGECAPKRRERCGDGKRQLESQNFVSNPGPVSSQLCGLGRSHNLSDSQFLSFFN